MASHALESHLVFFRPLKEASMSSGHHVIQKKVCNCIQLYLHEISLFHIFTTPRGVCVLWWICWLDIGKLYPTSKSWALGIHWASAKGLKAPFFGPVWILCGCRAGVDCQDRRWCLALHREWIRLWALRGTIGRGVSGETRGTRRLYGVTW